MKQHIKRLPDAEWEVMQALWACQAPAESTEIEKQLHRDPPMAATTLLTLLSRLEGKGFLRREKQGRGNRYTPLVGQEEYLAAQSRRFVDTLCGGDLSVFASALCESGLSREEIEELRKLLEGGGL